MIIAACLVLLQLAGACFPTSLTWGFHFLGFLPPAFLIGYLALAGIFFGAADRCDRAVTVMARWMTEEPKLFLFCAVLVFVTFTLIFRVTAPLLGDSFVLIPPLDRSHFLSFLPATDGYQAYTLLSRFHAIDLMNLAALLLPAAAIVFFWAMLHDKSIFWHSVHGKLFVLAILPILMFAACATFDLGMAKDWDVIAPYSFVIGVAAVYWISQIENPFRIRMMGRLVGVLALQSISYFTLTMHQTGVMLQEPNLSWTRDLSHRMVIINPRFTWRCTSSIAGKSTVWWCCGRITSLNFHGMAAVTVN